MFNINIDSIKKICGNSNEICLYGFEKCYYADIREDLSDLGFKAYWHSKFPPLKIKMNKSSEKDRCKAVLTSLIIENIERESKGIPIIPLLFCIELQNDDKITISPNLQNIAHSSRHIPHLLNTLGLLNEFVSIQASLTDSELRRCFKLFSEIELGAQKITEKTLKFVRVKVNTVNNDLELEEIAPFWEDSQWMPLWNKRMLKHELKMNFLFYKEQYESPDAWRQTAKTAIKTYRS